MKNLAVFFLAPGRVVGSILLTLCSLAPVSHASVIINNTGNGFISSDGGGDTLAQVFQTPNYSGNISSLSLVMGLGAASSSEAFLYATSGGVPTGSGVDIGTVSTTAGGSGFAAINVQNPAALALSANTIYAIVLQTESGSEWAESGTMAQTPGGDGVVGSGLYYNGSSWAVEESIETSSPLYFGMDLEVSPVPEVPMTGVVMGFGALAIGLGQTLRRKLGCLSPASFKA